jgi:hypothetical protein
MRLPVSGTRLAGAVWLALAAGCYRYVPLPAADAPTLAAGTEVRLHLTPEGSARVGSALGAPAAVVTGRAERAGGDSVSVLVSETAAAAGAGARTRWVGERVTISAGAVTRGERRALDRRRSLLAGGGVVLAAAAGYALLRAVAGGGVDAGGEPGVGTP